MPDLGRWGAVDPKAEKYFDHSPYHYVKNDPIKFIDPNGMENSLYLYGAEGADRRQLRKIKRSLNRNFRDQGLDTRARIVKEIPKAEQLDESDAFVFIGSQKQVEDFNNSNQEGGESGFGHIPSKYVEESIGEVAAQPNNNEGVDIKGNIILISTDRAESTRTGDNSSFYYPTSQTDMVAGLIWHGSGHTAGLSHSDVVNDISGKLGTVNASQGMYGYGDDRRYSFMGTTRSKNEKFMLNFNYYMSRMTPEQRKIYLSKYSGRSRNTLGK